MSVKNKAKKFIINLGPITGLPNLLFPYSKLNNYYPKLKKGAVLRMLPDQKIKQIKKYKINLTGNAQILFIFMS